MNLIQAKNGLGLTPNYDKSLAPGAQPRKEKA
jgi:hypothetical protein